MSDDNFGNELMKRMEDRIANEGRKRVLQGNVLRKLVGMFRPAKHGICGLPATDCVIGPDDSSLIGFPSLIGIPDLLDEFGLTVEEARWFVDAVHGKEWTLA